MIAHGAQVANSEQALVKYRVGAGAYARRGGRELLKAELALQVRFLSSAFVNRQEYVRNVAVRGTYCLVPTGLRRVAYRLIIATRGARLEHRRPPRAH